MPVWIVASIFAAFMQNLRFLLQRHLKVTTLSTGGATWARFLYSAPLVAVLVLVYAGASGQGWPGTNARFWGFVVTGGLAQMLATACVVALFARRNFTVGITLKKTEVIRQELGSLSPLVQRQVDEAFEAGIDLDNLDDLQGQLEGMDSATTDRGVLLKIG